MKNQKDKAPPSAVQAELEKLQQEQQRQTQAVFSDYQKAKTDQDKSKIIQSGYQKIFAELWPRYQNLIQKSKGGVQVQARLAALQLTQMGQKPELGAKVIADLIRENRDQPEAAAVATQLRYLVYRPGMAEEVKKSLLALGNSKSPTVQAAALFSLADVTKDKDAKKAALLYRDVISKYPTTSYAKAARASIFEAERLQIGMVAPEIEGMDHEGKPFRLSEYRGKVVVLDFWGFW